LSRPEAQRLDGLGRHSHSLGKRGLPTTRACPLASGGPNTGFYHRDPAVQGIVLQSHAQHTHNIEEAGTARGAGMGQRGAPAGKSRAKLAQR